MNGSLLIGGPVGVPQCIAAVDSRVVLSFPGMLPDMEQLVECSRGEVSCDHSGMF